MRLLCVEGDSLGFELLRSMSTIALPDVTGGAESQNVRHRVDRQRLRRQCVQGDDRLEYLRRADPAPDEDLLGGGVVQGRPDRARHEAVDRGPGRARAGRALPTPWRRRCRRASQWWSARRCRARWWPTATRSGRAGRRRSRTRVIRSISAVDVVDVDRPDVGDEAVALLGGQAHVGEDVHPGGQRRGRRGGSVRLGGEHRSTGEAADGERGEGRGDQGFAHGPDRSPLPRAAADRRVLAQGRPPWWPNNLVR